MPSINIAVLDDYQGLSDEYFNDADWRVTVYRDTLRPYDRPETPESVKDELVKRLVDFEVICSMRERTPFPASLLSRLPNLKLLLTTGLRNASIDLTACRARGIPVAGTPLLTVAKSQSKPQSPSSSSPPLPDSTTEHTVALILGLSRGLAADDRAVKSGGWQAGEPAAMSISLAGKTLGVVGLGRLGAAVARVMHLAFGMRVVAWSENLTQEKADEQATAAGLSNEVDGKKTFCAVSREEVFELADVVTVHLVLSNRSRGLITRQDLQRMKPSAILINTSRGPLVVEQDLLDTLAHGKIRGAALDVFDVEPLPEDSPWRTTVWGTKGRSQVLLTPHVGYVEADTFRHWYREQVENIKRWQSRQGLLHIIS